MLSQLHGTWVCTWHKASSRHNYCHGHFKDHQWLCKTHALSRLAHLARGRARSRWSFHFSYSRLLKTCSTNDSRQRVCSWFWVCSIGIKSKCLEMFMAIWFCSDTQKYDQWVTLSEEGIDQLSYSVQNHRGASYFWTCIVISSLWVLLHDGPG